MCLNTKLLKPLVAKKDIKVYKILDKKSTNVGREKVTTTTDKNGILTTTTVTKTKLTLTSQRGGCTWTLGKTNGVKSMDFRAGTGIVERALHAYTSQAVATREAGGRSSYRTVIECVIPKGAKYFTGRHNGGPAGTASEKLKFIRIVR